MFGRLQKLVNLKPPSRLTIAQYLTNAFAPPVCILCRGAGQAGDEAWGQDLCLHCEAACPSAADPHAPVPAGCDEVRSLYLYVSPVDQLITRLKFGQQLSAARVLGMCMARTANREGWRPSGRTRPLCIVPIPLHPQRMRERGYNQAMEIARHLAPRVDLPIAGRLLERMLATEAQSTLPAAIRRRNVTGAFRVREGQSVPERVVLLDDVMTTGSTLAAAAGALKSAGVRRVDVWVAARAVRATADAVT